MNEQASKSAQNPYPGLRPYREDEKDNFFGREADCKILIDKILVNRLTLLFAATGVGKSSLLQAAVIPQLKSPRGENLDVVYYNDWISNPLNSLKLAVRQALEDSGSWQQAIQYKPTDDETLADFLHFCALFTRQPLIVVLDQFEEFFRYQKGLPIFEVFLEQLTGVFSNTRLPVHLVFSMREDFALELNAFKQFVPLSVFDNLYRLDKLRRKQARQAILAPLEATEFSYEPKLLEQLLTDLLSSELRRDSHNPLADRTESVEPPYLQIVCSQLWDLENANDKQLGKVLHLKTYQQAGGAIGLLENYIQKVLKTFSEQEKVLASKAFDHLISRDGAKMPYKTVDLAKATGTTENELEKVLVKLAQARILRSQSREEKIWYELYHDMFSGSIEGWNSRQKEKMRNRRMVIIGGSMLVGVLVAYFGTVAVVHRISHHLRLAPGDENRVEIFTGKQGWPDPFGQKGFYAETRLLSREIEPDKRFLERGILDYQAINTDLIAYRPLEERISAYVYTGDYAKAIGLFEKTVNGSGKQASAVVRGLFSLKNLRSFEKIRPIAASEKNASVNATALTLFRENINSLNLDKFEEFRFYEQILKQGMAYSINAEGVKSSPLLFFKWLNYLKHPNLTFRGQAASVLGRIGDRVAVEGLLKALGDDNEFVRRYAAEALGEIGDHVAVDALLKALGDDNESVRQYAAEALGEIGDHVAVEGLLKALSDDNEYVRQSAAEALGEIGDHVAVEGLLKALSDDDEVLRRVAAEALGEIGDHVAVEGLLKALSGDNDEDVRRSAASALGEIGGHVAVEGLLKALSGDNDEGVRRSAALALGEIGDHVAVEGLLKALSDDNEDMRRYAAEALGEIGDHVAVEGLLKALSDDNASVQRIAAEALGRTGDRVAVEGLLKALGDDNEDVRGYAASALGRLGDRVAVEGLLKALGDDNEGVRQYAAEALGLLGDRVAVDALLKALGDDNEDVRRSAAYALGRLGDRVAVEGLLKALNDDNEDVRQYAASALGLLGDRVAVEGLLKALNDDNEDVRRSAASALGLLGDRVAVEGLLTALSDDNEDVRRNAAEALGQIGDFSGIQFKTLSTNDEADQVTNPYRWSDFFLGRLGLIYGTLEDRQQLLAGLNLPASEARDLLLLQLAADTAAHASIREKAIEELGGKGVNKQQIITELKTLSPEKAVLKRAIKTAIDKLTEKPQVPKALIKTKTQLTQAQDQLNKIRQRYAAWRSFRDSKTSENFPKPEDYDNFLAQVRTKKAAIAPLAAFDHAYAITEADPKAGVELLTHPLARARQGAYTAFAMKANIDVLRTLDEKREQNRKDPIFRHTAFRAIDLGLQRLEALGNKDNDDKEYKQLMAWQKRLEADKDRRQTHLDSKDTYPDGQPVDEVLERLQWTTMMMAHTKKMTAKFAKDGWVRDWPENATPVNQPYPTL